MGNTLTLYRRHSHRLLGGRLEWTCEHADSRVFKARPNPVKVGSATFMLLAHEPDPKSKREVSKDCDCPIVCDGSLANERDRIRRRSLGTKSKGPEGGNIDLATLRKYDVLLNDRLLKWCDGRGITSIKQLANETTCEDFVLSWRYLNPTKIDGTSSPRTSSCHGPPR